MTSLLIQHQVEVHLGIDGLGFDLAGVACVIVRPRTTRPDYVHLLVAYLYHSLHACVRYAVG